MSKKEKETVKAISKNIRFNYFESMLIIDEEVLIKINQKKGII